MRCVHSTNQYPLLAACIPAVHNERNVSPTDPNPKDDIAAARTHARTHARMHACTVTGICRPMPDTKLVVSLLFFFFFFFFFFVDLRGIRHRSWFTVGISPTNGYFRPKIFLFLFSTSLRFYRTLFLRIRRPADADHSRQKRVGSNESNHTILRPSPPSKFLISSRSAAKEKSGGGTSFNTGTERPRFWAQRGPFASTHRGCGPMEFDPPQDRLEIVRTDYEHLSNNLSSFKKLYMYRFIRISRVKDLVIVCRIFRPPTMHRS